MGEQGQKWVGPLMLYIKKESTNWAELLDADSDGIILGVDC